MYGCAAARRRPAAANPIKRRDRPSRAEAARAATQEQREQTEETGSPHVTALASEAMQHVDAVVVGEGESVWLELLEDAARGELKADYDTRAREFSLSEWRSVAA